MGIPLAVGASLTYDAVPPAGGTDPNATWSTSNAGVMSVSTAGPASRCTITGVAPGNATLTCTDPITGCQVKVDFTVGAAPGGSCAGFGLGAVT